MVNLLAYHKMKFLCHLLLKKRFRVIFYDLSKTGKPAILSIIIPECSDAYEVDYKMSQPLSALFDEEYMDLSYDILLQKCQSVYNALKITEEQAKNIEVAMRDQVRSRSGFVIGLGDSI